MNIYAGILIHDAQGNTGQIAQFDVVMDCERKIFASTMPLLEIQG